MCFGIFFYSRWGPLNAPCRIFRRLFLSSCHETRRNCYTLLSSASILYLQGNEPSQQRCGIELTDDGLNVGETASEWMQRRDIPVAHRRQSDEAKVDQVTGNAEVVLKWPKTGECMGLEKRHKAEQRYED